MSIDRLERGAVSNSRRLSLTFVLFVKPTSGNTTSGKKQESLLEITIALSKD